MDRQNKRKKAAEVKEKHLSETGVNAELEKMKELHPELYEEARKFARRYDGPEQQQDEFTLKYIKDALKESARIKHEDALLAKYQSSRAPA